MRETHFFAEALGSLMTGADFGAEILVSARNIDQIIQAGLGPVFYRLMQKSDIAQKIDPEQKLRASDITSRFLTAEMLENIESIIGQLQDHDIDPVILKGVSFATRYYEEPHLRVMADIDLLLPRRQIRAAEQLLLQDGYVTESPAPDIDYSEHIHSAPLFHPDRKLWFELHRSLINSQFASSREAPLDLSDPEPQIERFQLGAISVRRFRPEFELLYLATGWCFDLTGSFGRPGLQRGLVDGTLILKTCGDKLDWDLLLRWSAGTFSGACLYVLLSFLKQVGAFPDRENVCQALAESQHFVNATNLNIMHGFVERHLVRFENYGRYLTRPTIGNLFAALLQKEPAWKNLLAVPGNILFPRHETRRYNPQYHFGRIRSVLKRKS